jgi:hypothetical protein
VLFLVVVLNIILRCIYVETSFNEKLKDNNNNIVVCRYGD